MKRSRTASSYSRGGGGCGRGDGALVATRLYLKCIAHKGPPPLREPGSFVFPPLFQVVGLGCPGDECFDVAGVEVGDAGGAQVV